MDVKTAIENEVPIEGRSIKTNNAVPPSLTHCSVVDCLGGGDSDCGFASRSIVPKRGLEFPAASKLSKSVPSFSPCNLLPMDLSV